MEINKNDLVPVKLRGEIDLSIEPNEVRLEAIENPWIDFAYWLEAAGFMASIIVSTGKMTKEEAAQYAKEYITKCIDTVNPAQ